MSIQTVLEIDEIKALSLRNKDLLSPPPPPPNGAGLDNACSEWEMTVGGPGNVVLT